MDAALHDEHVRESDREFRRKAMSDLFAAPAPDERAAEEHGEAFDVAIELDEARTELAERKKFKARGDPRLLKEQADGIDECKARIALLEARLDPGKVHGTNGAKAAPIDFAVLATRQQLIDAFGAFTGMGSPWFDNVKDTPKLMAARKFAGRGGRGHIAEPLFCPYEVMLWLADPKRRKGGKLSADKAWELLERHFPKVYSTRSIGDPRTD